MGDISRWTPIIGIRIKISLLVSNGVAKAVLWKRQLDGIGAMMTTSKPTVVLDIGITANENSKIVVDGMRKIKNVDIGRIASIVVLIGITLGRWTDDGVKKTGNMLITWLGNGGGKIMSIGARLVADGVNGIVTSVVGTVVLIAINVVL